MAEKQSLNIIQVRKNMEFAQLNLLTLYFFKKLTYV